MYQLHYFPANANAAHHTLLEELGANYELSLARRSIFVAMLPVT